MSEATGFNRLQRSVVANDAIDMLKTMILDGNLVAHQRLPPERELAEMLGVSRPTLRESIRALIALNILESRHGEGTFVTSLDPGLLSEPIDFVLRLNPVHLRDLTEVRQILEPRAAAMAARRMTPEQRERLREVVKEFGENLDGPDDVKVSMELDTEFHRLIVEASGNAILITMASTISALTRQSRRQTAQSRDARVRARAELEDVLAGVESAEPEAASKAMDKHIAHIAEAVERISAEA